MADEQIVTAVREELEVRKRVVDRGGYRITKSVETREEVVDEPLLREECSIERRPINQIVSSVEPPVPRHEGDTMILPVLEEVLVVEKRLMLKEELRITRRRIHLHEPQRVELRTENVLIERTDPSDEATERPPQEHT